MKFIELPEMPEPFFVATDLHYSAGGVEVQKITANTSSICGKLASPWEKRIQVAGAFPLPDGSWQIVTAACDSNGDFVITQA